jgi:hypothetical protein
MGHNILYTKNTKLCIRRIKHQAIQVLREALEDVYVKTGKVKGFSIEGYFADKMERPNDSVGMSKEEQEATKTIEKLKSLFND